MGVAYLAELGDDTRIALFWHLGATQMNVPEFLQTLSKAYAEHPLAPSLILSHIKRKDGSFAYYAAIHTFPSGFASRNIVCSHLDPDYEACLRGVHTLWTAMQALLTPEVEASTHTLWTAMQALLTPEVEASTSFFIATAESTKK